MLDYGAAPAGRPATDAQRAAYDRNLICESSSGPVWSFLGGRKNRIVVMRDGILLLTIRRGSPDPDIEEHDWFDMVAIDLRAGPVRINARGADRFLDGFDKASRRVFHDALTQARIEGIIPPHVVLAGTGTPQKRGKGLWTAMEWICGLSVLVWLAHNHWPDGGSCAVEAVTVRPDVFIVNGQADAGFTVRATISNSGHKDTIHIKAVLATSEGSFTREQDYTLMENGRQELAFGFPEPTINATNVRAHVSCDP